MAIIALALPALHGQVTSGLISGAVTDSVHHRPLASAMIIALPTRDYRDSVFHSAMSDAQGRFTIAGLPPGRYALAVEHPYIDSSGVGALPLDVDVKGATPAVVALGIPSVLTLRRALCPIAVKDTTVGVVLGTVRRLDRQLAAGVAVVFTWSDFDVDRATATVTQKFVSARVVSDSRGIYRACGLPVARTLFMQAQGEGVERTNVIEQRISDAGVLVRDFVLAAQIFSLPADDAATRGKPGKAPVSPASFSRVLTPRADRVDLTLTPRT